MINMKMIGIKQRNKASETFQNIFHFELKSVSEVVWFETPTVNEFTKETEYEFFLEWEFDWTSSNRRHTLITLDIFAFEDKMKEKGYKEDKSLSEFVLETYWKKAQKLIDKLL